MIKRMLWLEKTRKCFESDSVWYSRHARVEMRSEEFGQIEDEEVYQAICAGEVIEEYPNDASYPSFLIFGKTGRDRPLHVLCAYNQREDLVVVVAAYQPNPELWVEFRRRKK